MMRPHLHRASGRTYGRGRLAVASAVAALFVAGSASAQSIGINFVDNINNDLLNPFEVAGAPGYAQSNWNNSSDINPDSRTTFNGAYSLLDSNGGTVDLTVAWAAPNTWRGDLGTASADHKLMNGYIDSNNSGVAGTDLTDVVSQPYVAISGLPAEYTNSKYRVIVYFDGDETQGRISEYWITTFGGNLADVSAETELTPHVFGRDSADFSGAYTQVPLTSTSGASAAAGNYIVFDNLDAPSFVLRADEYTTGITTPRAPINAIQIFAVPPAVDTVWTSPTSGDWFNAGNWSAGVPNNTSDIARFLSAATSPATVNLNAPATIRGMVFDNANGYTIAGFNSLTAQSNEGATTIEVITGNHAIQTPIFAVTPVTFDVAAGSSMTLTGGINAFTSNLPITKAGGGTLNLGPGGSWFWGALTVNGGTVNLGDAEILPFGGEVNGTGGTVDLKGFNQSNVARLNGSVNVTNTSPGLAVLSLSPGGTDGSHSGVISGNVGLVVTSGLQALLGANTFTGPVTVLSSGILRTQNATALGDPSVGTILDGGELSLWNTDIGPEPIEVTASGGTMSDRGRVGGPVTIAAGFSPLTINANSGVAEPIILAGTVSGEGGIVKVGGQGLVLGGDNTFSGGINVQAGWVGFASDSTASTSPAGTAPIELGSPGVTVGLRSVAGNRTVNNDIFVKGDFSLDSHPGTPNALPGGVLTLGGTVDMEFSTRLITVTGEAVLAGKVTQGGIHKAGPGVLTLTNPANDFQSGIILAGGYLAVPTDAALGPETFFSFEGGILRVLGTGISSLTPARSATINWFSFNGGFDVAQAGHTFTVSETISGGGSFTKGTGAGTVQLTAANSYSGNTTVLGGTLKLGPTASIASSAVVDVRSGATFDVTSIAGGYPLPAGQTLTGNGTVAGTVLAQSGSNIAPRGNLSVERVTLSPGSNLTFTITSPSLKDTLTVTAPGGLTINGGTITAVPIGLLFPGSYPVINYSGTLSGNLNSLTIANANAGDTTYSIGHTPGSSINVVIGTMLQTWTGAVDGTWDTATANWSGAGSTYVDGKPVRFDDTGANPAVNVVAPVAPSRIDLANSTVDYAFSGATIGGAGTALNKTGRGTVTFSQALTHTGPTSIRGGVVQLGGAVTMNATSGITLGNEGSTPAAAGDTAYPLLPNVRGGTLYLADDSVADRTGAAQVTLRGGTIVATKGPVAGNGSVTVQNVTLAAGMSRLMAAPAGGTMTLNVGSLTRSDPTATVQFNSQFGILGEAGDNGQIRIGNFSSANLVNGLIGAWATVGDTVNGNVNFPNANFASYDDALGVIPNVTNVSQTLPTTDDPTLNVRDVSGGNQTAVGSITVNSLISSGDIVMPVGSTLTINSGAAMMSGQNKWWQTTDNNNPARIQAGPGVTQMVFTVLSDGTDHRLRLIVQDNGAPLDFIKNGDGWLRLHEDNTYTGQTIVNAGTLALSDVNNRTGSLGAGSAPVIVRSGATLDVQRSRLGMREVIIEGAGVGGNGALVNNNTNGQNDAVRRLTLTGDATIGGVGRFDIRTNGAEIAEINGGTFTLTKVGSNQISIVNPDHVTLGAIIINGGRLGFESKDNIMGDPNYTATINPGGTLFLWNNIGGMSQNKPLVLNGGTILGQNNPNTLTGTVRVNVNSTLQADSPLTLTGAIFGPGGIIKAGGNVLTLTGGLTYTGATTVSAGTLRVTSPLTSTSQVIMNGGYLAMPGGDDPAATLDDVAAKLAQGRNGGTWDGVGGITSAAAAANTLRTTGVGYALNNDGAGNPLRPTVSSDVTEVLVRYTYNGDADLDGAVDADDYLRTDAGFMATVKGQGPTTWVTGDFDYDRKTTAADYYLIDAAFALQGAALGVGGPDAVVPLGVGSAGGAAVPEPASAALLALGATGLLARRRRPGR